ncbi:MAG TPA: hypothetical protein VMG40_17585 [Bryobacteraceae bacterium]|nr:hypothetical protein [Bryobacteraceae bacterium]
MWRAAALFALTFSAPLSAQVERWLAGPQRTDIRWSVHARPASLSRFQRLLSRFTVRFQQQEIDRRRNLLLILAIRDYTGKQERILQRIDLSKPPYSNQKLESPRWVSAAFLLPGTYEVTFAAVDLKTRERSLARRRLNVATLQSDPLQSAWHGLPSIEFITSFVGPDAWFLPEISARLSLPLESRRPINLDIVMNTAVSEIARLPHLVANQTLPALVPVLKTLSQIDVRSGALSIAVVDGARRETIFAQDSPHELDWAALKRALRADNPHLIDTSALHGRDQDVQFLLNDLDRRIEPRSDGALRAVIFLSPPMSFPSGIDRAPIQPPADPDYRVFYVRVQTVIERFPRVFNSPFRRPVYVGMPDQLEGALKPLHPRTFEIWYPNEFRKALASILHELSDAR